jgi:putative peptidoglycan lipid II flippase
VAEPARERSGHAFLVAAGIFLTRLAGLLRQTIFLHFFGLLPEADAFLAAVKVPNFLQNILGEGSLSASFIPVYARLLAEGDQEEADHVAGAVGAILTLTTSVLVLIGILATPWLIDLIAYGFDPYRRDLTIRLVRILFPGVGMLVPSAWCLGILNSHRKFFLSYTAPLAWNAAMIVTLLWFGGTQLERLAVILAWGSVVGSVLQFGVQLPLVLRLAYKLRITLDTRSEHVREVVRNFLPVFLSRGVVQISAYIDVWLAGLLPEGAVAGLYSSQLLYTLPVSLFGMSVSAAELPAMSSALGEKAEVNTYLRGRLNRGLRQIAFFIVPSAMGFLAMGGVITGTLFQTGRFSHGDTDYVWGILAGSSVGLLASTLGRLYSSTYYALRDTRTPLNFAVIRIALTAGLGYVCALHVPRWIGIDAKWGVAGLTASAGIAGWVEFTLLRLTLNRRIGPTGLPVSLVARLWIAAALAAAAGWGVKLAMGGHLPKLSAVPILGAYGVIYFGATYLFGIDECVGVLRRFFRAL